MNSQSFPRNLLQIRQINKIYLIKAFFWLIAIFLGLLQAWASRYKFSSGDIIAYLDMGEAYFRGDWQTAIHGYFSPLYPLILTFFRALIKPSMYWDIFSVKIINFILYVLSLLCFEAFLVEFINYYQKKFYQKSEERFYRIPEWAWLILGYLLFLWSALVWIGVNSDTPDMLVAGLAYLATALVLRVHTRSNHWWHFIALGVVLGLGYLAKTFMFLMAFVFLVTCFLSVGNIRKAFPRVLVAFLVFCLITAPFISALSKQKGYLTFGNTGKLNYAWNFNGIKPRYWQGEPPGSGTPKHRVRKIFENPATYEFAKEFPQSTLPIGYDTSYWYEGVISRFNLLGTLKIIPKNFWFYYTRFGGILLFIYLILICVSGRLRLNLKNLIENWRFLIPAFVGLGLYMLAIEMHQSNLRYLAPFIVLLFAGVLPSVSLPNSQESKRLIAGLTLGALILIGSYSPEIWQHPGEPIYWKVAQGLHDLGIHSRDKVAVIQLSGSKLGTTEYWAKLGKLTIVAEVPDAINFWKAEPTTRAKIYKLLQTTGANAIVHKQEGLNTQEFMSANGWQRIGKTDYYVYLFETQTQTTQRSEVNQIKSRVGN